VRLVGLGREGCRARGQPLSWDGDTALVAPGEIALKVSEILQVPALGYSAAELRHGPARIDLARNTRVGAATERPKPPPAIDELVRNLDDAGDRAFTAGGAAGDVALDRRRSSGFAIRFSCWSRAYRAIEFVARPARHRSGQSAVSQQSDPHVFDAGSGSKSR